MSGRVVWYRDGERTIGFRKTTRRQSACTHLLPPWVLSFELPLGLSVRPDVAHGLIGVTVAAGHVGISGKKDWALGQAHALLRKLQWRGLIKARLTRAAEQGATIFGPVRPAIDRIVTIDMRSATVTDGATMRQLEFRLV